MVMGQIGRIGRTGLIGGIVIIAIIFLFFGFFMRGNLFVEDRVGEEIELTGTVTGLPEKSDGLVTMAMDLNVNGEVVPAVVAVDFRRDKVSFSYSELVVRQGSDPGARTISGAVSSDELAAQLAIGDVLRMTFWMGDKDSVIARQTKRWLNLVYSGNFTAMPPELVGLVVQIQRLP